MEFPKITVVANSPDPVAGRTEVHVGKPAAGVHANSTGKERLKTDGDRIGIEVGDMNVERVGSDML